MADYQIIRDEHGRFLPGTTSPKPITSENTREYARLRREKAAAKIRRQIVEANNAPDANMTSVISAAGGVANAAGALWSEVVLNPTAYPRDRLEAWERISRHADVLSDGRQAQEQAITPAQLGGVVAGALIGLRDMLVQYQSQIRSDNSNYRDQSLDDMVVDAESQDADD